MKLIRRNPNPLIVENLIREGHTPLMARIFAGRGVTSNTDILDQLKQLPDFRLMKNIEVVAAHLADAIQDQKRILIYGDMDCDGATSTTVGIRGLRAMGAVCDFFVPRRDTLGYGLSRAGVEVVLDRKPDIILTVDNGISSIDGVRAAHEHNIEVLITDHHEVGDELPDCLIVNPKQPGCSFPAPLAGVGVIFYVLLALRAELRQRGMFTQQTQPQLADLLDIVALGTIADMVKLDPVNRLITHVGLQRLRRGKANPGIRALLVAAGKHLETTTVSEFGFIVGPRINAAGRLDDMTVGIRCLLTDDPNEAAVLASQLDQLNRDRREIEEEMKSQAIEDLKSETDQNGYSIVLYSPEYHQGVVGLLSSRIKDVHHRPTVAFADGDDGILKGSARSIPGIHLRDAIDLVSKRAPGCIKVFGGHAGAAGLSIYKDRLDDFRITFEAVCQSLLSPEDLDAHLDSDGELESVDVTMVNAQNIRNRVWGHGFPAPIFDGIFEVQEQKLLQDKHLKLILKSNHGWVASGIYFGQPKQLPIVTRLAFRMEINSWRGNTSLQMIVEKDFPA
jgi:single-stranded-DNA-specific exonuclease